MQMQLKRQGNESEQNSYLEGDRVVLLVEFDSLEELNAVLTLSVFLLQVLPCG